MNRLNTPARYLDKDRLSLESWDWMQGTGGEIGGTIDGGSRYSLDFGAIQAMQLGEPAEIASVTLGSMTADRGSAVESVPVRLVAVDANPIVGAYAGLRCCCAGCISPSFGMRAGGAGLAAGQSIDAGPSPLASAESAGLEPEDAPLSPDLVTVEGGGNGITGARQAASAFNPLTEVADPQAPQFQYLLTGYKWGGSLGSVVPLTYSLATDASVYGDVSDFATGKEPLENAQRAVAKIAVDAMAAISGLTFLPIVDDASQAGDIRFGNTSHTDNNFKTAIGLFPSNLGSGGDIWFGTVSDRYKNPVAGDLGYVTFMHELGHALGLRHPHQFDTAGMPVTLAPPAGQDQLKFSIMSYRSYDGQPLDGLFGGGYKGDYFPTTPMINDVLALQFLYGKNTTFNSENNDTEGGLSPLYSWPTDTPVFQTIWDTGGTDVISAANQAEGAKIFLTPGKWSEIGKAFSNGQAMVRDNLTIAYGVQIENATGSAFDDTLEGNEFANSLVGGNGNDWLSGLAGTDTLVGGAGNDTYDIDVPTDVVTEEFGAGTDLVNVGLSAAITYSVPANVENATVTSDGAVAVILLGNALDNALTGNAAANTLVGGAGNDTLDGGQGVDSLAGGPGNDVYVLSVPADVVNETATGSSGVDRVELNFTATASYTLPLAIEDGSALGTATVGIVGNTQANRLTGNAADNLLDGGTGIDTVAGGPGDDHYVLDVPNDAVQEAIDEGIDLLELTFTSATTYTLPVNVEKAIFSGALPVHLVGNGLDNELTGGDGANSLTGFAGNDTLFGMGGADTLDGGTGADTLVGGTGDDTLSAVDGNDQLSGGDGNDRYAVSRVDYDFGTTANTPTYYVFDFGGASDVLQITDTNSGPLLDDLSDLVFQLKGNDLWIDLDIPGAVFVDDDEGRIIIASQALSGNAVESLVLRDRNGAPIGDPTHPISLISLQAALASLPAGTDQRLTLSKSVGLYGMLVNGAGGAAMSDAGALGGNWIFGTPTSNTAPFGNDTLTGTAGNDSFLLSTGRDLIDGGSGTDKLVGDMDLSSSSFTSVSYAFATGGFRSSFGTTYASLTTDLASAATSYRIVLGSLGDTTATGIEQFQINLTGTIYDDLLIFQNGTRYNGGAGSNDTFYANWSAATTAITWANNPNLSQTVNGVSVQGLERLLISTGSGNDAISNVLAGGNGNGNDDIRTGLGNDTVDGGRGGDLIDTGDGDDQIVLSEGADVVQGGAGTDKLVGDMDLSSSSFTSVSYAFATGGFRSSFGTTYASLTTDLASAATSYRIVLGSLGDTTATGIEQFQISLTGTNYDDLLIFQNGTHYNGGAGTNDTFYANWSAVPTPIVWANDPALPQVVNGVSVQGLERLLISTGSGNDNISNVLAGGNGNDDIRTGLGNDTVDGGRGGDLIDTGDGDDQIVLSEGADVVQGGAGTDKLVGDMDLTTSSFTSVSYAFAGGGFRSSFGTTYASLTADLAGANASYRIVLGSLGDTTATGIEQFQINLTGTIYDDLLIFQNGTRYNGGAGSNDTFYANWSAATAPIVWANDPALPQVVNGVSVQGLERLLISTGSGNDSISNLLATGNGNDDIHTGLGNDTVDGGSGDDLIDAGAGNDTLDGGDGDDQLTPGTGIDLVIGGAGFDTVVLGSTFASYVISRPNASDLVLVSAAASQSVTIRDAENIVFSDGARLAASLEPTPGGPTAGPDTLVGDATANLIDGLGGNDSISGLGGNDTLIGGSGTDTLVGGPGNDQFNIDLTTDSVVEAIGEGTDLANVGLSSAGSYTLPLNVENATVTADGTVAVNLTGNTLNNALTGNAAANNLSGDAGNDTLSGGDGDDQLIPGTGIDLAIGGPGIDTVVLSANFATYTITRPNATDLLLVNAAASQNVTLREVESIAFVDGTRTAASILSTIATTGADTLIGDDNPNSIDGLAGNDSIGGLGGNDTLIGGAGIDTLIGGLGDDVFRIDVPTDVVDETAVPSGGIDRVEVGFALAGTYPLPDQVENATVTSAAAVNLTGNGLNNLLVGNAAANSLVGAAGNDTLDGGTGTDTLAGGAGNDTYRLNVVADVVDETTAGSDGIDTVELNLAVAGSYALPTGVENARVSHAGLLAVTLTGNASSNQMSGGPAADTLSGGAGNDTLAGGTGNDRLDGGNEYDLADYGDAAGPVTLAGATGVVTGAAGTDTLVGIEVVQGSAFADVLVGSATITALYGGGGNDSITGADTASEFKGGDGIDTLRGGTGSDFMSGGPGSDLLDGGAGGGIDSADFFDAGAAVFASLATGLASAGADVDTLVGIDNLHGTVQDDTLVGNDGANYLYGSSGADSISGGTGNDTLEGSSGNDTLIGGDGFDMANFSGTVNASLASGLATSGAETDSLSGIEALQGGKGNDTLTGDGLDNRLIGGKGNDSLVGGKGNDTLHADADNDTVDGGADTDVLVLGSAMADYAISLPNATDVLFTRTANGQAVTVRNVEQVNFSDGLRSMAFLLGTTATSGPDNLVGDDNANVLDGLAGNDTLTGLAGDDTLIGGPGIDSLVGGPGNDVFRVDVPADAVVEAPDEGVDRVEVDFVLAGTYALPAHVEDASVVAAVAVNLTGNALNNRLTGGAAGETLAGGAGNDTLVGGPGNDRLDGGDDADQADYREAPGPVAFDGGAGVVAGAAGTDTLVGIETVQGSGFGDTLVGSADGVALFGNGGDDSISGGAGFANLDGGTGNDTVRGGNGPEFLTGGPGSDLLDGGGGIDQAFYYDASSAVALNLATGLATSGTDVDTLAGIEYAHGSNFNDTLTGSDVANYLWGGGGADSINGGASDDTLDGSTGNDTLVGGTGFDLVIYGNAVNANLATGVALSDGDTDSLSGIEALRGGKGNDTLTGDGLANGLDGGSGDDSLAGGAGNDTFRADSGNDTLDGGADIDLLVLPFPLADYGMALLNGTDLLLTRAASGQTLTVRNVEIAGFADGQRSIAFLLGLPATTGPDALIGDDNANLLDGLAGNDSITGLGGNDTLIGGPGVDTLVGGKGDDVFRIDVLADQVVENAGLGTGADRVEVGFALAGTYALPDQVESATVTSTAAVNLTGNGLNNLLIGNALGNSLQGAAGGDTLDGGAGIDTLAGGAGDDTYRLNTVADVVNETAVGSDGHDRVELTLAAAGTYVLPAGVDEADLRPSGSVAGHLTGNGLDNVLWGNAGTNALTGGAGNDTLIGGGSAGATDSLDGGADIDTAIVPGARADYSRSRGVAADEVFLNRAATGEQLWLRSVEQVQFSDGTRTFAELVVNLASAFDDTLTGTPGPDSIDGLPGNDSLDGLAGNDTLLGSAGNDTLIGGEGADLLIGGLGVDSLVGGADADVYNVDVPGDVIVEAAGGGDDLVQVAFTAAGTYVLSAEVEFAVITAGPALAVHVTGNARNNLLQGSAGNNSLVGGEGLDTLNGGAGIDTMVGGAGNDQYQLSVPADVVTEAVDGGIDLALIQFTAAGTYVLAPNLERAIDQTALAINQTGNALDNHLTGGAGANSLGGALGADTLLGGPGNDTLAGGDGNDSLAGEGGTDSLLGDAGDDTLDLRGGDGNDTADGGAGALDTAVMPGNLAAYAVSRPTATDTVLTGASQVFTLRNVERVAFDDGVRDIAALWLNTASPNADLINGTAGPDALDGLAGNDTLLGLAGDDTLIGGAGVDSLVGGPGDDAFEVDVPADVVVEALDDGTDRVDVRFAAVGSYTLPPNVEDGTVTAAPALAVGLNGNALPNHLVGNAAANALTGGAGNDTLDGGPGADNLAGGAGDDTYVINLPTEVVNETALGSDGVDLVRFEPTAGGTYLLPTGIENAQVFAATPLIVNLTGNGLPNTLRGHTGNNSIGGAAGDDTIVASDGADTVDGGLGDDLLQLPGNAADYTITRPSATQARFAGNDGSVLVSTVERVQFGAAPVVTLASLIASIGSTGADTLVGGADGDTLDGGAGNDSLDGAGGADSLLGGAGNDTLLGGPGTDWLDGGDGSDTYAFGLGGGLDLIEQNDTLVGSVDAIVLGAGIVAGNVSFSRGHYSFDDLVVQVSVGASVDQIVVVDFFQGEGIAPGTIDQLRLASGQVFTQAQMAAAALAFDGGNHVFVGLPGNDTITGDLAGAGTADWASGGGGADSLSGLGGDDTLFGGAGADRLLGGAGNDLLAGGEGIDTLVGDAGNDTMSGGAGGDRYEFGPGSGSDTIVEPLAVATWGAALFSGVGPAYAVGLGDLPASGDVDTVALASGITTANLLPTRVGDALRLAIAGTADQLEVRDYFALGVPTIERFVFANGAQWSAVVVRSMVITPTAGNDTIVGYIGGDVLTGLSGNDLIDGREGNDFLNGGDGADTLTGGSGGDRFTFAGAGALTAVDTVTDFTPGTDKLALSAATFTALAGAVGTAIDPDTNAFTAYNPATGAITYDADGEGVGAAGVVIALLGVATHPASLGLDILVVP